jgi:DNA-binding CsgD family transcriptional regulator
VRGLNANGIGDSQGTDRPAALPLDYPLLLEREAVVAATTRLLEEAAAGRGRCLFIVGESGLGKTAALQAAVEHGTGHIRIALARGDAMEQLIPFGMLSQAIDQLGGSSVLGLSGTAMAPADARATRFFAVLRWLESHTEAPTMIGLDDLHWADPDSLGLLSFLARRIGPLPVALIATLRPWPPSAYGVAAGLAHDGHAELATLSPLSEVASGHLLSGLVGRTLSHEVVSQAWEFCSGNPLLLEQVATILSSGDPIGDVDRWGSHHAEEKLLLSRFAGLPPEGISLIRAASVLGFRFRADIASEMAGLGEQEAATALEALHRSRLVRPVGGTWLEFVHPLFHQALYEDAGPAVQTRLHARAFKLLHARGLDDDAAEHAVRAELVGDAEAVAVLEASARAALGTGALGVATERLGAAVALAGQRASPELLTALCQALLVNGRSTESIAVCERLLAREDLPVEARVQVLRLEGLAYASMARHDRAAASYEQATGLAEPVCSELAAEVLVDYALVSWLSGGPARSLPLALRAKELTGGRTGRVPARAAAAWGYAAWMSGDPNGLDAIAAAAAPLVADPLSDVADLCAGVTSTLAMYTMATSLAEQFADSDRAARGALAAAEQLGAAQTTAWFSISHSYTLYRMGRLAESLALAERAEELSEFFPMVEPYLACARARLDLNQGRVEEAMAWCEQAEQRALPRGEWFALLFTWDCLGQIHLRRGDPAKASDLYRRVELATEQIGLAEPCFVPWGRNAVASHLGCGRPDDARRVLAWLERCQEGLPCRWPRIAVHAGRARLAEQEGDRESARVHFESALNLHEGLALPLEHVETLLDYGAFLRRSGEPVQARHLLANALQRADRLGAVWLGRLATEELRVAGGRRRRRRLGGLTPQEQRVARAAAAGKQNAELAQQLSVSVNTIETHLRHIYAKLGIRSRSELAARMAETRDFGDD